FSDLSHGPRCPSGKVWTAGPEGSRFENRFHSRPVVYVGLFHAKSVVEDQTSSRWCGAEVWSGSAGSGVVLVICPRSKLRGSSQNIGFASKRGINIAFKLTDLLHKTICWYRR
ncbi:hypothetical protein AVEN_179256-1, partial [Araneus ventricosus]